MADKIVTCSDGQGRAVDLELGSPAGPLGCWTLYADCVWWETKDHTLCFTQYQIRQLLIKLLELYP